MMFGLFLIDCLFFEESIKLGINWLMGGVHMHIGKALTLTGICVILGGCNAVSYNHPSAGLPRLNKDRYDCAVETKSGGYPSASLMQACLRAKGYEFKPDGTGRLVVPPGEGIRTRP